VSVSFGLIDSGQGIQLEQADGLGTEAAGRRAALTEAATTGAPAFLPARPGDEEGLGPLVADDARAIALLPLLVGARAAGVVTIGFAAEREFDADDQAFLVACAAQAALALERARLYAETADTARRSAFLAEASYALAVVTSVAERAERLAHLLVPAVVDAARVALQPAGDEESSITVVAGDRDLVEGEDGTDRLALPLDVAGRVLGTLTVARAGGGPLDRQLLEQLAERAAVAIENARLYEQERSVAHVLQQSLLAGRPPADPRFAVGATYSPGVEALVVGGDWYDTFTVGDNRVAAIVGDVVGRGLHAATTMGQLRSAVRALALVAEGPAQLLERLDDFVDQVESGRMATVAYVELALDTGVMRYACAGHPPPVVLAPGERPEYLWDGRSMPLGVDISGRPREEGEMVLPSGSRLLLYSDGLVERRDEPLGDGLARLADAFASNGDEPLPVLASRLAEAMSPTDGSRDDVCVLCCSFSADG
jgi:serine/threonine-protein kinase RsbW